MVEDEPTNKTNDTGTETNKDVKTDQPLSLVEEVKAMRDELLEAKKSIKEEREKLEKATAEALLSGSAGGHVEAKPPVEETPKEYNDRVEKEIGEGKHAD